MSEARQPSAALARAVAIAALLACAALPACDRSPAGSPGPPHAEPAEAAARPAASELPEPPPPLDGARLLQRHACLRCHRWEGVQVLEQGPSLDHAGNKLRPGWLDTFLRDPSESRMPVIRGLGDAERRELVAWLAGLRRQGGFPEAPAGDAARGAELFQRLECAKCHRPERPELDLADAPDKLRRDWLVAYLQDPPAAQPGAQMPSFSLSGQDATDLAEFLLQGAPPPETVQSSATGLDTFVQLQCISCHPLQRFMGTDMQPLLNGNRTFDAHARGSGGVPRIPIELKELLAIRKTIAEWTGTPATGTQQLAETSTVNYWQRPVPAQGQPPADWTGLERSLHPAACGTCHPRQHYDWKDTIHARAYSYGFTADMRLTDDGSCLACHAPLTEQYADPVLRHTSINCASCHVRAHARHAPPKAEFDTLDGRRDGIHDGSRRHEFFQSAEFCARCHQFRPGESKMLENGFLMNTFEEWKHSPAAAEGQTCQTCHMPDRRHLWRGIHDPGIVREYLDVRIEGRRIMLTSRAGHKMPTYMVPRINVSAWLEDAGGREIEDTRRSWGIQRRVQFLGQPDDHDIYDTRLDPGETRAYEYDRPWGEAAELVVSVDVEPDEHYLRMYDERLKLDLDAEIRHLFRLARAYPLAEPYNVTVIRTATPR